MALGWLIKAVSLEVCVIRDCVRWRKQKNVTGRMQKWVSAWFSNSVFACFYILSIIAGREGNFSMIKSCCCLQLGLGKHLLPQAPALPGTTYGVQQRRTSRSDLRNKGFVSTHFLAGQMMSSFWGREKERKMTIFTSLNLCVLSQTTKICLFFLCP